MLLLTLLWKNAMVIRHHYIMTIIEVALPIAIVGLMIALKGMLEFNDVPEVKQGKSYDMLGLCPLLLENCSIVYCPNTGGAADLGSKLEDELRTLGLNKSLHAMSDEEHLNAHFSGYNMNELRDMLAVVFENTHTTHYEYTLKATEFMPETTMVCLQLLIDFAIMSVAAPGVTDLSFQEWGNGSFSYALEQLPAPAYAVASELNQQMHTVFLGMMTMVYAVVVTMLANCVLNDKCSGATELVKIMGMKRWEVWGCWLLKVAMVQVLVLVIVVVLLKVGEIFGHSDALLIYVLLMLYVLALTCYMFAITAPFYRALWGVLAVTFFCVAPIFSFKHVMAIPNRWQWVLMLIPTYAYLLGGNNIVALEFQGVGSSWCNLASRPDGNTARMLTVLVMLVLDIVLYLLLAYYIEAVWGGTYGIAEPWYYPVNKLMQLRQNKVGLVRTASAVAPGGSFSNYELPSKNDQPGISIANLRKVYPAGNKTVAVDGVTLDVYRGQITVLLGHNGAGKTTTMSIITGMIPATSGTVWVNDFNIRTDLEKVRRSIGLCTQQDIICKDLTVMENLIFFGVLKGNSRSSVRAEAKDLMRKLDLKSKRNSLPDELSGGQKRKLCMCVALIGGSQVVILDEPTSGMDPEARRIVWDLLLAMRGKRTILITTHYMEEADALGDKVAILDHGKVVCYGSVLYLKNKFGGGFKLTMIVLPNSDVTKITKVVQSNVSGSELKSRDGAQLNYLLPASRKQQFADMFDVLERRKEELGVVSMGVSAANMDDVFLAVGKQSEDPGKEVPPLSERWLDERVTGLWLTWQQFVALLNKKFTYVIRKWIFTLVMALLPILLWIAALSISLAKSNEGVASVAYSVGSVGTEASLIYYSAAADAASQDVGERYRSSVVSQGGPEPRAVEGEMRAGILAQGYESPHEFVANALAAGEIAVPPAGAPRRLVAMYGQLFHAKALTVNLVDNAVLRHRTNSNDYSITAGETTMTVAKGFSTNMLEAFMGMPSMGLLLLVGSFLWLPTVERVTCGKQIQSMTGATDVIYWLTCFLVDFLLYLVVVTGLVVVLVCFDAEAGLYSGGEELRVFVLVVVLFGLAQIPIAYLFSCTLSKPTLAFTVYVFANILYGISISLLASYYTNLEELVYVPPYGNLKGCLETFILIAVVNNRCNSITDEDLSAICSVPGSGHYCCPENRMPRIAYLEDKAIWKRVKSMLIYGTAFWLLLVVVESGLLSLASRLLPVGDGTGEEDQDVTVERKRVRRVERDGGQDMLLASGLAKKYGLCTRQVAVKQVTLGVFPGECFGLLGTNGAGKTTTFKMLTGGVGPTRGDARIHQYRLSRRRHQYLKQIGYCPQEDAILEELTGREILVMFAQLRGVPRKNTQEHVTSWIQRVGLAEYEHKPCGTYSGGNKRKLSTAAALIGDPPVVFLDEPTSGIDPVARRSMWAILTAVQRANNCIVLTSHSMDECEALCNRLSIQVNGELKCIGSIPYLKQKFGQGFSVMMRLKDTKGGEADVEKVRRAFIGTFSPCELRDEHSGMLQYHVSNPSYTWKFLFQNMESLKDRLSNIIEDYSLSETSLEEIFLSFAKASK